MRNKKAVRVVPIRECIVLSPPPQTIAPSLTALHSSTRKEQMQCQSDIVIDYCDSYFKIIGYFDINYCDYFPPTLMEMPATIFFKV